MRNRRRIAHWLVGATLAYILVDAGTTLWKAEAPRVSIVGIFLAAASKHLVDTFPVRLVLTGSSSVLVAKGGRESLAGRVFSTEIPTFSFREVVEAWSPALATALPPAARLGDAFNPGAFRVVVEGIEDLRPQQKLALSRRLERYIHRGG